MISAKTRSARKSFDYQCQRASKCRHEKYMVSCNSCPEREQCEIQEAIGKAMAIIKGARHE